VCIRNRKRIIFALTNISFCRKTTLKKHAVRSHLLGPGGDVSGNEIDADEEFEDEDSPSPIMQSQELMHYDRSPWNLPPHVQAGSSPYRGQMPSNGMYGSPPIKRESSMRPGSFTSAPSRTTSDPGYNHYPHPDNMNQGQIQNLSQPPTSMPMSHAFHNGRPAPGQLQTNLGMMNSFNSPDQIVPQPLQASPSTMSNGSSAAAMSPSQDYPQEYASPASYHAQPSYTMPQPQMGYPHLHNLPSRPSYSMDSYTVPPQAQAPQQLEQQYYQASQPAQEAYNPIMQRQAEHQRKEQLAMEEMQMHQQQMQAQQTQQQYEEEHYQEPELVETIPSVHMGLHYYSGLQQPYDPYKDEEGLPSAVIPSWAQT
jgi:hypothetical protein